MINNKWKYDYLQMMNRKKQHNFQICDGERNLCAGSLKICQTSPSKLARWAFILPCIVQCSHARSSWVVYICWMFIDNCVFDINLLQDATFVCVVSWPLAPWEELEKSKEYHFIKQFQIWNWFKSSLPTGIQGGLGEGQFKSHPSDWNTCHHSQQQVPLDLDNKSSHVTCLMSCQRMSSLITTGV